MAKKRKEETEEEILLRRLGEYIEYATARRWNSDVGFYEYIIEYIKRSSEKPMNNWIDMNVRPPPQGHFLGWIEMDGTIDHFLMMSDDTVVNVNSGNDNPKWRTHVTHWMPLPNPPNKSIFND